MAEIIAGPYVSFVVKRLGEVLIQEANFLRGVSGQVEEMQRELNRMQCFLKDAAAKREEGDERVHNWVAEIREAAYDAEAVIDTFIIKVGFRRETGSILNVLMRYSCVFKFKGCIAIHKVGVEINSIKTKIASIRTSLETYGISAIREGESSSSEKQRLLRRSYPHIVEEDIVGLDDDIKTIVEHLVKEERQCRVVSIWGMGGLGKTTLAKKVYNHNDVRRHFDSFAWAFISQQCNVREVLEGILIKLSIEWREQIKLMKHEELVEKLFEVQSQKKCLVVIDDIWKAQDWEILSTAFPNKKDAGSKILLTTRIEEVASYADQLHKLRHLTKDESWELFEKKASTEFELSTKMMELGKEMVKHCGGLPLAIVVLGGLLANKHRMGEWEMVSRNISYYLNKKGKASHGGVPVSDILALSYQDLPYHLKACFLYLSHLPEDYFICAEKLVQMWMAEGIVSSSVPPAQVGEMRVEETMLDVGMSYLSELVQRCMVQIELNGFNRRIRVCRLHDLMRDLCLLKTQEENFLKVVRVEAFDNQQLKWENSASSSSSSPLTTIRRLVVYYLGDHDDENNIRREYVDLHELSNHDQLRSCKFYSFGNNLKSSNWEQIISLLKGFKLLRILDVERMNIKGENGMLPRDIGNLFHLRYLNIKDSNITSVPSSIGNLRFLQTLDLRTYANLEIPNVLWRLEQLRHLYLPERIELTGTSKLRLDGLSKLETLEAFDTKYCDVRYFPKLTNLRKVEVGWVAPVDLAVILKSPTLLNNSNFSIRGDFRTEEEQSLLRQLLGCHHLHKLHLCGSLNMVKKLPDQFPPNLTKLTLYFTELEEDPMPTLEKLPNLRTLILDFNSYIGKEMVCSSAPPLTITTAPSSSSSGGGGGGYGGCDGGGFPKLKSLELRQIENLEEWRVEQGAMPCLFRLQISYCEKLKEIPDGLRFITTLHELYIKYASKALRDRVREGGEDFYKVHHQMEGSKDIQPGKAKSNMVFM
ncbi:unnamed protein product [Camellia sinensis]